MNLNESNFNNEVIESDVPVVVDFWAQWCQPCLRLTPILDKLEQELGDKVKVCKVNVDSESSLASHYDVSSIPHLAFFKGGKVVETAVGLQSESFIRDKLTSMM